MVEALSGHCEIFANLRLQLQYTGLSSNPQQNTNSGEITWKLCLNASLNSGYLLNSQSTYRILLFCIQHSQ